MLGMIVFLGVGALLAFIPRMAATKRMLRNPLPVRAFCWLAFLSLVISFFCAMLDGAAEATVFFGVAVVIWIVGLIWALAAAGPLIDPMRFAGPPVVTAGEPRGPGRFTVQGVDRATKLDTTWHCNADSEANARVKADLEGIIVTSLARE